jgi:transposase
MFNNFWSYRYLTERIRCTAENYGIINEFVDERGTSSMCPRCGSEDKIRRGRLFKYKSCGLEAHCDAVRVFNIGLVHGNLFREGDINWGMTAQKVVNAFDAFHSNLERTP